MTSEEVAVGVGFEPQDEQYQGFPEDTVLEPLDDSVLSDISEILERIPAQFRHKVDPSGES